MDKNGPKYILGRHGQLSTFEYDLRPDLITCANVGQQTQVAIIDLFICGAEPTSSALAWAILCLVAFPDIQRRCHDELDTVSMFVCI